MAEYFPDLQSDIDELIGRGAVQIHNLRHVKDWDGRWLIEGNLTLAFSASDRIIQTLRTFSDERRLCDFFSEMAFAFSALSQDERLKIINEDATYTDNRTGEGAIIDFAEWRQANYSANAANFFDRVMPDAERASPAEKLHLYVHHMRRRLTREG